MANLQIKGIDDDLYVQLKALAASENRSISQQVVFLVKSYLSKSPQLQKMKTPAQVLLELSGSWEDAKPPEQIIENLKKARKNSQKFKQDF
jgi:hypothetical protein